MKTKEQKLPDYLESKKQELTMNILKGKYDPGLVKKSIEYWENEYNHFKVELEDEMSDGNGDITSDLFDTSTVFGEYGNVLGKFNLPGTINDLVESSKDAYLVNAVYRIWVADINCKYLYELRESNEVGYVDNMMGKWVSM